MYINRENYTFEATTDLPNNVNQTDFDIVIVQVVNTIYLFFTPTLVVLGTIGNMLSVFVFHGSKLRLQSTSLYLSVLAIADNVFLLQLLPPWLSATGLTSLFHKKGFCQFIVYVSYVSCCLSAWLVVAFTVERFVAVVYPLRRNAVCSVNRARQVILLLSISAVVLNLPVLRFASPSKDDCNIDRQYLDHAARFNLVDTLLSFTVPLGVIVIMNAWIMVGVCRLERARQALMREEQAGLSGRLRRRRLLGCQSQQKVTRMLLLVSSVFVILNMPAYAFRILAYAYDINANEVGGRWTALQQLSVMCFHANFGINFLLYCLSGQTYRRALMQALPWFRRRARRAVAVRFAADPPRPSVSNDHVSTEATVINMAVTRRRRPQAERGERITRWKFDNSRQLEAMAEARARAEQSELTTVTIENHGADIEMRTVHTI